METLIPVETLIQKTCGRCKCNLKAGLICEGCKRDMADEAYLDYGSEAQVHEQMDRGISGEYYEIPKDEQ